MAVAGARPPSRVDALERERLLTPEQKVEVRRLIDGWFQRDERGAGGAEVGSDRSP